MDIEGPVPIANEGKSYMLVFMDHLTKNAEVIRMANQRVETVSRAFVERIALHHGVPQ